MKKPEDFLLGAVSKNGYYPITGGEEVVTDKTIGIPEGSFVKHDFTTTTHQEIADVLGISVDVWIQIYFDLKTPSNKHENGCCPEPWESTCKCGLLQKSPSLVMRKAQDEKED